MGFFNRPDPGHPMPPPRPAQPVQQMAPQMAPNGPVTLAGARQAAAAGQAGGMGLGMPSAADNANAQSAYQGFAKGLAPAVASVAPKFKKGGKTSSGAKKASSPSKRADGIAQRGKTKGRMV